MKRIKVIGRANITDENGKLKSDEELRAFITSQLAQREQYYMQAKHVFDVSLLDNFEKIHASVAQLRELLDL